MREYILLSENTVYKIGVNPKGQLCLSQAEGEESVKHRELTKTPCRKFSADIDASGVIHIAAVIGKTLTYLRIHNEKTSTTHLMHLPDGFNISSVIINADVNLRLNYCVKGKDGSAVIEYELQGDSWQGKNVYTTDAVMELVCAKKGENKCYGIKKEGQMNLLFNAYKPDEIIFSSSSKIEYCQATAEGIVFLNNSTAYSGSKELSAAEGVFVCDSRRILAKNEGHLREYSLFDGVRFSGEVAMPRGAKEYVLCCSCEDKRIIISSPFPFIKTTLARAGNGGLMQEVYIQQRALFSLQAELKSLKNRVRKLEEEMRKNTNINLQK